uniref:Uncharacterized protein n=1 Tax=Anopheles atroparvus TaxID=41427 RepID=A0A182IMI8_ANOAO
MVGGGRRTEGNSSDGGRGGEPRGRLVRAFRRFPTGTAGGEGGSGGRDDDESSGGGGGGGGGGGDSRIDHGVTRNFHAASRKGADRGDVLGRSVASGEVGLLVVAVRFEFLSCVPDPSTPWGDAPTTAFTTDDDDDGGTAGGGVTTQPANGSITMVAVLLWSELRVAGLLLFSVTEWNVVVLVVVVVVWVLVVVVEAAAGAIVRALVSTHPAACLSGATGDRDDADDDDDDDAKDDEGSDVDADDDEDNDGTTDSSFGGACGGGFDVVQRFDRRQRRTILELNEAAQSGGGRSYPGQLLARAGTDKLLPVDLQSTQKAYH